MQAIGDLADNIFFVLFVYLLVIGVWSAACNHDFISAKWKSVQNTRRRGLTHFFVITLPMAYILAYIFIQSRSGDFKEVGAAAVALCFAWLHLSRTFWGLWQLYEFKRWATEAIRTIESLGFEIEGEAKNLADQILVNDTIIDNRLMEGLVRCNLRFISPMQVEQISARNSHVLQLWMYFKLISKGVVGIFKVISWVLIDYIDSKAFFENTPYIEPLEPEELWLRWASVLVADAIPEWLNSVRYVERQSNDSSEFTRMRNEFAEEILLSAALHVDKCDKDKYHSFLPYNTIKKFKKLSSGKFSKYEFLRNSILTGNGLPFNAPHSLAFDEESGKYGYNKFGSKLKRIVDSLPADRNERIVNLNIFEVEWLAVFLSLKTWKSGEKDTGLCKYKEEPEVDDSDFPVINLSAQLGYIETDGSKTVAQHFDIPLHKYSKRNLLWGNRNLLECSLHIDNWIAITAGRYIQDMIRHSNDKSLFSSWSFEYNKKLEYDRNRFQQLFMAPFDNHFEQTLTFLGCSMECLRTILARWTVRNEILQRSEWNPKLKEGYNLTAGMSKDFQECLDSICDKSDLKSMYFQMRLLWELQKLFRKLLLESEAGPSSENAMILCILSYPALSIDIIPTRSNQGEFVSIPIDEDNLNDDVDEFHVSDLTFKIKAEGLPKNCEVLVSTMNSKIQVKLEILEGYLRFNWEEWRNSFQGRLAGLRQWQWENWCWSSTERSGGSENLLKKSKMKIETTDNLLRSNFPISSGMSRIKLISAGTGERITLWKGWLPHRRNMCHFELESKGLIKTRKHLGYEPIKVKINGDTMLIQCPQVQYQTMSYDKCDRESLQRSTVISAAAILDMFNGKKDDDESSSASLGESLRKMGNKLTQADNFNFTVSITMFETAAVYYGDFQALEKAIGLLKDKGEHEQASTLIELYFYTQFSPKNQFKPKTEMDDKLVESRTSKLRLMFEDCVRDSNYDSSIAERYAQFCLCIASTSRGNCIREAKLILQRVFLNAVGTAFSGDLLQCIKLYCSMLVRTELVDDIDLEGMIMSKMREFALSISEEKQGNAAERKLSIFLRHLRRRVVEKGEKDDMSEEIGRDIEFSLARLFQEKSGSNVHDADLASSLYERAAEKGHTSAAYNFAIMLQKGLGGVEKNAQKAKELYIQAAEGGMFRAAFNVARLLQRGDNGIDANPSEAIKYFNQAIDAGYMKAANNLGNLYKKGAAGVEKNIEEAIRLFSKASDAGSMKSTFALVDIHLDETDREVYDPEKAFNHIETALRIVKEQCDAKNTESIELEIEAARRAYQEKRDNEEVVRILSQVKSVLDNISKEFNESETVK